jgi:hypothetical protein
MDFWSFILSTGAKEVSATIILVGVVVSIFTGLLVPGRTAKRELTREREVSESHRLASEKKDLAIAALLDQNSRLLAGVRIADKFYADFVPSVDEFTRPRGEVPRVVE